MSSIALFDMDGTLTSPRERISKEMFHSVLSLLETTEIGIVTGSGLEYIKEQLDLFFNLESSKLEKIHFFPCNGTKYYKLASGSFDCLHSADMIENIGMDCYRHILQTIFSFQLIISLKHKLPFTGTFFQYRGSMLNWCPVGRSGGKKERQAWISADQEHKIRESYFKELKDEIKKKDFKVDVALGGSTSFDIYPSGWDKTYVVNHLADFERVFFTGDNCKPGGNDYHLYELLNDADDHQSYSVDSTTDTLKVIEKITQELNRAAQ